MAIKLKGLCSKQFKTYYTLMCLSFKNCMALEKKTKIKTGTLG